MDFSEALQHLRQGKPVQRAPWAERGVTLVIVGGVTLKGGAPPLDDAEYRLGPMFMLMSNHVGSTWTAPTHDVLAEDWQPVEPKEDPFQ